MITFGSIIRSRYLLWLLLSIPLVVMSLRYRTGGLFYGEVIHASGELSVRLMIVAMAATPLMLLFPGRGFPRWLLRNRRYFGVASFAYAALHTLVYLERTALPADILADGVLPEYLSGWIALFVFFLLAITSNDRSVIWLKRLWKALHRWVYAAAVLSFVHWLMVAFNPLSAFLHLALLAGLEASRVWKLRRIRSRAQ